MITVAVLAFNEERLLETTVRTIIEAASRAGGVLLDIIVVNDGSTDRTADIIRGLEEQYPFVRSVHHEQNRGPGIGARTAVTLAKYPKFISAPGDNDLSEDLLTALFKNKDRADMVLAYYGNMHERGRFRSLLSKFYTSIYRIFFQLPIQYINSPCLYPTEKLRKIKVLSTRFGYSAEMTVKMLRCGCSFVQVQGSRRHDDKASSALSWKNLQEVIGVFFSLLWEVYGSQREQFKYKPVELSNTAFLQNE